MAAKPRVTVRLAPSTLHALAYIAERDHLAPAEVARMMISAGVRATLQGRGWAEDHQDSWRAWLAEQAGDGGRPETPDQADYDRLAEGLPTAPTAPAPAPQHKPLSATIAESAATIKRIGDRLASGNPRA